MNIRTTASLAIAILALGTIRVAAQGPTQGTPRTGAPIDLIGTWVSVVTEDWMWRMVTPPKGDYTSVPLNDEGRKVADEWDPARDETAGSACKSYGAAALMRVPGRLKISWQDDTTLKIDADAGQQTRLLHFGDAEPSAGEAGWQGYSEAHWQLAAGTRAGQPLVPRPGAGSLKVVTTRMKPGYLRKNGVPYSERAVLTEYFNRHSEPNGDDWFTVVTIVDDPKYLTTQFITSTHFKREPNGAKWRPTPCSAK